jgi:excisionase family DNA binding protein
MGPHPPIALTVASRVAEAFARNGGNDCPVFDVRDSLLVREETGIITFDPQIAVDPVLLWTPEGRLGYNATLEDLYGPQHALLEHRTGYYGLIGDFGPEEDGVGEPTCFLAVACHVTDTSSSAYRMVGWMAKPAIPNRPQEPEIPAELEDLISPDHPLRDIVSPLALRESPFFSVNELATVMGVPVGKIYPKLVAGEIAFVQQGAGKRIPRAEFTRLAALYLRRQPATKREVVAAAQELEKVRKRLLQAVEPLL